ncbi:50S ribosomal protein L24 [Candidatus Parcubacteria bacterium A4]|nr:MAG: 50S ribosomal protein L24 [Candidatus Parcubacteria bacterium A4]
MKIKKEDIVLIISGKDKGKRGKVLRVFPERERVLVEGINLRKKHQKPRKAKEKGQIIEMPTPLSISNIKLICPKCGEAARVGYKLKGDEKSGKQKKYRICKKCEIEI